MFFYFVCHSWRFMSEYVINFASWILGMYMSYYKCSITYLPKTVTNWTCFELSKILNFFKKLFWVGPVWIVQYGNNISNFICLSIVFSIWYLEVKILGSDSEQEEGVLGWYQDFTVPREPLCVLRCENRVRRQDLKDRIWTLFSLNLLAFWSWTSQLSEIWEIPFCYKDLSGWWSFVAAV